MTRREMLEDWKYDVANGEYLGGFDQYCRENEGDVDMDFETPLDTPSLDTSFHVHEMDV